MEDCLKTENSSKEEYFLKMEGITKKFGEAYANKDVALTIRAGEVHTLLGENGAGKSTLMNILIGLYQPTKGEIFIKGEKVKIDSPAMAVKLGIGMVHQHFMLVEAMTVFENIILGTKKNRSIFINTEERKKEIQALAEQYHLDIELDKPITDISVGAQQRVEILKALYRGAELLILDEPTAALTDLEVQGLFQIIATLIKEKKSVIFISHKMREVLEISDRITILRSGQTIKTIKREEADAASLATIMMGKELVKSAYQKVTETKEEILSLQHVCYKNKSKHNSLNDVSIQINKGEILGIAGVDGNGQSQLAQIITGVLAPESGSMQIHAQAIDHFSPQALIKKKVAHIPEDRNKMGLVGNMSVRENLMLKNLTSPAFSVRKGLYLKKKKMALQAEEWKKQYDIRCQSIEQEVRNLSGGNQQKIILAREIEENPEVLVAVHPTRGLDIGATRYVHDTMVKARDQGCTIVLISADFDEILQLSDRIAVMFEGKIMGIFAGENPPIKEISLAMSGKSIEMENKKNASKK